MRLPQPAFARFSSGLLLLAAFSAGLGVTQPAGAEEASAELNPEVELALQIVNDYRTLRSSCTDQEEQARVNCFYRLRVGLWDYKEARQILAKHNIRVEAGELVAQRN